MTTKDSRNLETLRAIWVGRSMIYKGKPVVVVEVANDGSQCDHDQRRRAKFTGLLVRPIDGLSAINDTWHVQPWELSPLPEAPQ